jgi:hypothetical protein
MVKLLLNKGANPNIVSTSYSSPLNIAVYGWSKDIIKLMLDKGANVNLSDCDKIFPIHRVRSAEILQMLLDKGAKVNAKDRDKHNLLHYIAEYHLAEYSDSLREDILGAARLAIEKGIEINAQANYVKGGPIFIEIEFFNQATPLLAAVVQNNSPLVKLLLEKGANRNIKDARKNLPLFYAKEIPEILELFN